MNNEALLFNYLMQKQNHIKNILQPVIDDAGKFIDHNIHGEMFLDRARWILISDLCINCKLSVDQVKMFVDGLNVKELMK